MPRNFRPKPEPWFWVFSILALLWSLLTLWDYIQFTYFIEIHVQAMTEEERIICLSQPLWTKIALGISVFGGILGSISLLIRRKWAITLFLLALLAVLTRSVYLFFMTNTTQVFDVFEGILLPIAIIIISSLLHIFSKIAYERKWIT